MGVCVCVCVCVYIYIYILKSDSRKQLFSLFLNNKHAYKFRKPLCLLGHHQVLNHQQFVSIYIYI